MNKEKIIRIRDEILTAALPHVPFDGWSWEGIEAASLEAGHTKPIAQAVFPERLTGALDAFSDMADRAMLAALAGLNPEEMRVRDRVRRALLARYEFLSPYKEAVRLSLAFWMMPLRKIRAARIVWRTADRIWDWAGDQATDYNRYTKRGLLSGVIASTTLAWLEDKSPDMRETKEFLDRRIENVMQAGKFVGRFKRKDAA